MVTIKEQLAQAERERDEARAEANRLQHKAIQYDLDRAGIESRAQDAVALVEARAELATLRKDYDSVLEANVGLLDDAPWADVRRAYIRGAEAMRVEVMQYLVRQRNEATVMVVDTAIKGVHKLPVPEEP